MIRTCPKCGAYYADQSLAFCFADGTPLVQVAAGSERWSEGARVIEEKTRASRRQRRKLRWRRVALSMITAGMLTMVVSKSFVVETTPAGTIPPLTESISTSLTPAPLAPWLTLSISPSPSPSPSPDSSPSSSPSPSPSASTSPSPSPSISPSPLPSISPSPSPSPSAVPVYKISGRVSEEGRPIGGVKLTLQGSKLTSTTTDGSGYYSFTNLRAGGSYTITPVRTETKFRPANRSFDNLTQDGSADFNGLSERESNPPGESKPPDKSKPPGESKPVRDVKPVLQCTGADEAREKRNIIYTFGAGWRKSIEQERPRIIAENLRDGEIGEAALGLLEPQVLFQECKVAYVLARHIWQIKTFHNGRPARVLNVQRQRRFLCWKVAGGWSCKSM